MRGITVALMTLALALVGFAAFAQVTMPPTTVPDPVTGTCPAPELSVPAGIGAGPVPALMDLTGLEFDRAYIEQMYQHRTDIATLANLGVQKANDKNIRDLSGKIHYEQISLNQKLLEYNKQFFGAETIPVDYNRPAFEYGQLTALSGRQFDIAYTRSMIHHLQQARQAALIGEQRSTFPEIRYQAGMSARAMQNEIVALQRWLDMQTDVVAPIVR